MIKKLGKNVGENSISFEIFCCDDVVMVIKFVLVENLFRNKVFIFGVNVLIWKLIVCCYKLYWVFNMLFGWELCFGNSMVFI